MVLWNFCDEYFNERGLSNLLILVEDGLVIYLFSGFEFIWGIIELCKSICVEFNLYNILEIIFNVLNIEVE